MTNAESLGDLAGEVRSLGGRLDAGGDADGIGDVSGAVAALAIVLLVLAAIPAAGALAVGVWLRRFLGETHGSCVADQRTRPARPARRPGRTRSAPRGTAPWRGPTGRG